MKRRTTIESDEELLARARRALGGGTRATLDPTGLRHVDRDYDRIAEVRPLVARRLPTA